MYGFLNVNFGLCERARGSFITLFISLSFGWPRKSANLKSRYVSPTNGAIGAVIIIVFVFFLITTVFHFLSGMSFFSFEGHY